MENEARCSKTLSQATKLARKRAKSCILKQASSKVFILFVELPWDKPTDEYIEYIDWKEGKYMLLSPWKKLDTMALSLIKCILVPNPSLRITLEKIMTHRWMKSVFQKSEDTVDSPLSISHPAKRLCSNDEISLTQKTLIDNLPIGLSQPIPQKEKTGEVLNMVQDRNHFCFSQPVHFDDLILGSQLQFTQSPINKNNFEKLVSRMTRFFVTSDCEKTLKILCSVLEKQSYTWNTDSSGLLTITTVDRRKMQLVFKANLINMDGKLLLDFRLSKGCGLEFKKRFVLLKNQLRDIIYQEPVK